MALLPTTRTLDIASRGVPAETIFKEDATPNVNTGTMDIASRGVPAIYIHKYTAASSSQIKSVAGVVYASIKSLSGVAIANVKSFAGVSNV